MLHITMSRNDYEKAEQTAKDKVALSERGVKLVRLHLSSAQQLHECTANVALFSKSPLHTNQLARHLTRLSAQLELLTPNVPPLPVLPTFAPVISAPSAPQYNQVYATTPASAATSQQLLQQQAQIQQQQQYHAAYPAANYGMGTGSTAISGYSYATGDSEPFLARFQSFFFLS